MIPERTIHPSAGSQESSFADLPEVNERITVNTDLTTLGLTISQHHEFNDELSLAILTWHRGFKEAIRNRSNNLSRVVEVFEQQLQRLLCSPSSAPFDSEVYLGSDGHAYGKKALLLYLSDMPQAPGERPRSPLGPQSEQPFTVRPHALAMEMVAWLNRRGRMLHSLELERRYQALSLSGNLPALPFERIVAQQLYSPTTLNAQTQARRARVAQQQAGQLQQISQLKGRLQQMRTRSNRNAEATGQEAGSALQDVAARIEAAEERRGQQFQTLANSLETIQNAATTLNEGNRQLARQVDGLRDEVQQNGLNNRRVQRNLDLMAQQRTQEEAEAQLAGQLAAHARSAQVPIQRAQADQEQDARQAGQRILATRSEGEDQVSQLRNQLATLSVDIADLHLQNGSIGDRIDSLLTSVREQQVNQSRVSRTVDNIYSENSRREELENLLLQLRQLPSPVLQRIAPLRLQLAEDFLADSQRIDQLETTAQEQLAELQQEILGNGLAVIEENITQLEAQNVQLERGLAQLTTSIDQAERANMQMQLDLNKVEIAIKKRNRSSMAGLLKTALVIGACALVTGGISCLFEGAAVSATGGTGFQFSVGFVI